MHGSPTATRLRLPDRLAYTVLRVAVAGTLACSTGDHSPKPADASPDQYSDACPPAQQYQCSPVTPDASCPPYVCNPAFCDIASGCEPTI
ncbi:MAG TPA: hypothetical protein VMI75_23950 [Polyangiaceae bacterium]|nr:hypothetical protein [Polyangiaceae bacterium]